MTNIAGNDPSFFTRESIGPLRSRIEQDAIDSLGLIDKLLTEIDPDSDKAILMADVIHTLGESALRLLECRNSLGIIEEQLYPVEIVTDERHIVDEEEERRSERERLSVERHFEIVAVVSLTAVTETPVISLDGENPIILPVDHKKPTESRSRPRSVVEIPENIEGLSEELIEELISSLDLLAEEKALLRRFAGAEAVMVLHLQKAPGLEDIYQKGEWEDFKKVFPQMRDNIIEALATAGVAAQWNEYGRQKGKRYQLSLVNEELPETTESVELEAPSELPDSEKIFTSSGSARTESHSLARTDQPQPKYYDLVGAATAESTPAAIPVSSTDTQDGRKDFYYSACFSVRLLEGIVDVVEAQTAGTILQSELTEYLSSKLGTSDKIARSLVARFVESGDLVRTKVRQRKYVAVEEKSIKSLRETVLTEEESGEGEEVFTETDMSFTPLIFRQLLELTHVQQGQTFSQLLAGAGVGPEDEVEFRRTVRKLISRGYLILDKNANPNTRSDHSKKLRMPWVKIANQELKMRLKQDPRSVMDELESFAGAAL